MKIKLNDQNRAAITAALAAANGKATAHTFRNAADIIAAAAAAEAQLDQLGIQKGIRAGAKAHASSGVSLPNSYKYKRITTRITITRGPSEWFLISITTGETWDKSAGGTYLALDTLKACYSSRGAAKNAAKRAIFRVIPSRSLYYGWPAGLVGGAA